MKKEITSFLDHSVKSRTVTINRRSLSFTNLDKIYWPDDKITKRDMLNYYHEVAPFILTYLKDRPQSLNRFPNGINGKSFYQKDVTGKVPGWVSTYKYHSADEEDIEKHFLVPKDESALLLMANMGCIELHPWSSTTEKPDHPTWCVIDLDPDKNPFNDVIITAQTIRQLLDQMKVRSYCKTSGSTGLHIYIPLGAKYTYDQSKEFARLIVEQVQQELPKITTIERMISARKGRIYLDFLQNRPQATLAAPYSLRPKPGAPVSMPLRWDEVKKGLRNSDFNIRNAPARLRETGDIFKPVLGRGASVERIMKKLASPTSGLPDKS